ncbi:MAG: hypothetical protein C5B52_02715 [Bacteroidetes bacterium]|nr:MAG: hypothetical protein C5B52_02715 [Bacteroidota bacterium]
MGVKWSFPWEISIFSGILPVKSGCFEFFIPKSIHPLFTIFRRENIIFHWGNDFYQLQNKPVFPRKTPVFIGKMRVSPMGTREIIGWAFNVVLGFLFGKCMKKKSGHLCFL